MIVQDREGKPWTTPYFYANEIFILNFNTSDNFENAGVLPKEQLQSGGFNAIGFSGFVVGNELFVVFNDNPKNAEEYNAEKLKPMKSGFSPMIAKKMPGSFLNPAIFTKSQIIRLFYSITAGLSTFSK